MATQFNFNTGQIHDNNADNLSKLSQVTGTQGAQQLQTVLDSQAKSAQIDFQNNRAQAQDAQNAVINQQAWDAAGRDLAKSATLQYQHDQKTKAGFELYKQYNPKAEFDPNIDYATLGDNIMKKSLNDAQIASANASTNLSKANTEKINTENTVVNNALNQQKISDNLQIEANTLKDYKVSNPEVVNANTVINNNKDIVSNGNPVSEQNQGLYNDVKSFKDLIAKNNAQPNTDLQIPDLAGTMYTPEVSKYTTDANALKAKYSPAEWDSMTKLVDSGSVDKYIKANQDTINAQNIVSTKPAQVTETRKPNTKELSDYIMGMNVDNSTKVNLLGSIAKPDSNSSNGTSSITGSASSTVANNNYAIQKILYERGLGPAPQTASDIRATEKYNKDNAASTEAYTSMFTQYGDALTKAGVNLKAITTKDGLESAIKTHLDSEGLPKNSIESKSKLMFKSASSFLNEKEDGDTDSSDNVATFISNNQALIKQLSPVEVESFMDAVKMKYNAEGKGWNHNWGGNSPMGDAIDKIAEKWNNNHPNSNLKWNTSGY